MNGLRPGNLRKGLRTIGRLLFAATLVFLPASAPAGVPSCVENDDEFTSSFRLQDCEFVTTGENPYFILKPGRRLVLEGEDDGAIVTLFITVLRRTRTIKLEIDGELRSVVTRVVEEREFEDGEIKEVSRNFFAICEKTNDVFYFGEKVDIYEDGKIVSHEGAWLAGQGGAQPGIVMPGTFLLGSRYYQEVACGVALDRGENTRTGLTVRTPFGRLDDCVEVIETSPLEPGHESRKVYAPGIGLVIDATAELVDIIEDVD